LRWKSKSDTRPFFSYAAESWTTHYREDASDDATADLAFDLCDPNSTHFSTWFHSFITTRDRYERIRSENFYGISWTPLLLATYFGFAMMVRRILQRGDSVDGANPSGTTPLMKATQLGKPEIMGILLEAGANVNAIGENRETALFYDFGNEDSTKLLLKFGADVNHKSLTGTALQDAIRYENKGVIRSLLSHDAIDIDAENCGLGTALQVALAEDRVDMVHLLLEHGADVNVNGRDGRGERLGFPIALAAKNASKIMVQLLVEHGANINATGGKTESALSAAIRNDDLEMLKWLLENGADLRHATVDEHDSNSYLFDIAGRAGSERALEFLIKYRPDLHPDSPKHTLHAAMKYGKYWIVELVLDQPLSLSREDLQQLLEIECEPDDVDVDRKRYLIQKKLDAMPVE
jgi:ankyrin repeat protein